jgi:hypothetical protein
MRSHAFRALAALCATSALMACGESVDVGDFEDGTGGAGGGVGPSSSNASSSGSGSGSTAGTSTSSGPGTGGEGPSPTACESDAECEASELCDPCATSSCPECDDCIAGCVPHACDPGLPAACDMVRPDCGDGRTAVVRDGCYVCVELDTCEPPPAPTVRDVVVPRVRRLHRGVRTACV